MSDAFLPLFFFSSSPNEQHTHRHTNRRIMLLLSLNAGPTTTITPEYTGVAMQPLLLMMMRRTTTTRRDDALPLCPDSHSLLFFLPSISVSHLLFSLFISILMCFKGRAGRRPLMHREVVREKRKTHSFT